MFVQIGRQGDAGGLEDGANLTDDGGAGGNALAVLLDGGFLETIEIAQQVGPFDDEAVAVAQIGQLLLQHQANSCFRIIFSDSGALCTDRVVEFEEEHGGMPLAKFERKTIVPAKEIRHARNSSLAGP